MYSLTYTYVVTNSVSGSSCWGSVIASNNLPPQIQCDSEISVGCNQPTDIDAIGIPQLVNNCYPIVEYNYDYSDNFIAQDCSSEIAFEITRDWTITAPDGLISNCTQVISGIYYTEDDLVFPPNLDGVDLPAIPCETQGDLEVITDPSNTGEPIVNGYSANESICNFAFTYDDEIIPVCGSSIKIIRTWTALNWCNGDAFTHIQIIKVIDNAAPNFSEGCDIPNVLITDNTCSAEISFPIPTGLLECDPNYTLEVSSDFGSGSGPFSNVSPGTYEVFFDATDNCGNTAVCSGTIQVIDATPPVAYCIDGFVIELMNTIPPVVGLWASDVDPGSFDNCGEISLSFSPNEPVFALFFDCCDLGINPIELWVTDAAGNQTVCETYVIIQDNFAGCDGSIDCEDINIEGLIHTEEDEPVAQVSVEAQSSSFSETWFTNETGLYQFSALPSDQYLLTPEKDINPLNGITTLDAVIMLRHILGVEPITSPYKLIAADVNSSTQITTLDIVMIRKLILFQIVTLPNTASWRFVDAAFEFPNPLNPWETEFPETITVNSMDNLNADFIGIKIGDVNCTSDPNSLLSIDDRNDLEPLSFQLENQVFIKDEILKIPFKLNKKDINGFQFTLNFNPVNFDVEAIDYGLANAENFGLRFLEEGNILVSWNSNLSNNLETESLFFTLKLKAKTNGSLINMLSISDQYIKNEGFDKDFNFYQMDLNWQQEESISLSQNMPNPFSTDTRFVLNLETEEEIFYQITNTEGKVVFESNQIFEKGKQEILFKETGFPSHGVYFFYLKTAKETFIRKMFLMD